MDLKDSFNYCRWLKQNIDISIFAWVEWEAHKMVCSGIPYIVKPMAGVWMAKFSSLRAKEQSKKQPCIHWYKENFRQPQTQQIDTWGQELLDFEPRLKVLLPDGTAGVKNITSKGHVFSRGANYPSGQSSGSYVFDLSDTTLFQRLV
jgi:hypothetical protein